jgi:hypothetical protein
MGEVESALELLLFLEAHNGIESIIKSDQVLNLLAEVEIIFPRTRKK